jgi:hypothetical protein
MEFARVLGRVSLTGLAAVLPDQAAGQTTFPSVKLQGRLQEQVYYFGNGDYAAATGAKSNVYTRRARIEAQGQINEYVTVYIQPSFEGGRTAPSSSCRSTLDTLTSTVTTTCTNGTTGLRLRDAWVDVRLTRPEAKTAFTVRVGQEKRPFSRYELTSSNNLPSIERGGGRGLLAVQSNDLFGSAQLLAHDVGAHVRVDHKLSATRSVSVVVAAYNGRGESLNDNNDAKSFGFRATADVTTKLSVGGSYFSHDNIVGADSALRNHGYGLDGQWGKPGDEGLFVLAEWLQGQGIPGSATAAKPKLRGIQALAAYNIRMKSPTSWLYAIEPAVRVDVADPNTAAGGDRATLVTAVLGLYISSKAQFRIGVEHQSFQAAGAATISGVRSALTVNF